MSQPYFVQHKRGEINEIAQQLGSNQIKNKRDIIKKVIAYMSLGVDMSSLYKHMIMAAVTNDPVQKKMVYRYLCEYAQEKPEIALLCINTMQRDCKDVEPMIRGLALRSICSLRMPNILEYVLDPLRAHLRDKSPYVRRTAIMGWAKLHNYVPSQVQDAEPELLTTLFAMRNDPDVQVRINALTAIDEILGHTLHLLSDKWDDDNLTVPFGLNKEQLQTRGKAYYVTADLIVPLLNILPDIPEWGQAFILELATHYVPADEEEKYAIMDILELLLSDANSAVVLAAIKLFIHLNKDDEETTQVVYERVAAPLLSLLWVSPPEVGYVVLSHIKVLALKYPHIFSSEYRSFFLHYNDLLCVKLIKLQLLGIIADTNNNNYILSELKEYIYDRDQDIVSYTIDSIAYIAVSIETSLSECLVFLLSLLDLNNEHLSTYVIVACRDLLRKYPEIYTEIVPCLQVLLQHRDLTTVLRLSSNINTSTVSLTNTSVVTPRYVTSITSIIWMLGEFGQDIKAAPYLLEQMVDSLSDTIQQYENAENSGNPLQLPSSSSLSAVADIQMALLIALVKLLSKRAPEVRPALGRLFTLLLSESHEGCPFIDTAVRLRAVTYYRMLASSIVESSKIIGQSAHGGRITSTFWENNITRDTTNGTSYLIEQYNTLSVIYGIPRSAFKTLNVTLGIDDDTMHTSTLSEESESLLQGDNAAPSTPVPPTAATASTPVSPGALQSPTSNNISSNTTSDNDTSSDLGLSANVELDSDTFQSLWETLPEMSIEFEISTDAVGKLDAIESSLNSSRVYTMASGYDEDSQTTQFYFYAINDQAEGNDGNPLIFLAEVQIAHSSANVSVLLKSNATEDQNVDLLNIIGGVMTSF